MPKKYIVCLLVLGFVVFKIAIFLFSSRCFADCEISKTKYFTTGFHNCSLFLLAICLASYLQNLNSARVSVLQSFSVLDAIKMSSTYNSIWLLHVGSNFANFEDMAIEKMVGLS